MTAQHDYIIANAVGSDVRADINLALAAIAHQNEGATEPATMYAYQPWADTSTDKLKIRNAANTAWIDVLTLSTGDPLGSVAAALDLLGSAAPKLPKVTVVQASNALTISMVSQYMDFRNATLATGTPVTVSTGTPTDLVIPATSNLGMPATGVSNRYAILLDYNAGTPVISVSNLVGGLQLDEENLISPTTIGAASNSATTIYSAAACAASQPYKVIGIFDAVFTTGTGWSTPSLVQPGGQELIDNFKLPPPIATTGATYKDTAIFGKPTKNPKRVVLMLNGVSTNGTNVLHAQMGTGGTPEVTNYVNRLNAIASGSFASYTALASGLYLSEPTTSAAYTYTGRVVFDLFDDATNTYCYTTEMYTSYPHAFIGGGFKSLAGKFDMLRILSADTLDAGSISVSVEY